MGLGGLIRKSTLAFCTYIDYNSTRYCVDGDGTTHDSRLWEDRRERSCL